MAPSYVAKPKKKYKITFLPMNVTVEVDPEKVPYGRDGQPGSILDIALAHGIDLDHSCGGVCACSTCHVIVQRGFDTIPESGEEEDDQLEQAPGLTPHSRLGCQAVPNGECDLVVEIPEWNRNTIKEGH
ncbi:MAG: 2Fe-2S iron-sulfur cluster-binding protein [Pseudomonadota bacterium]